MTLSCFLRDHPTPTDPELREAISGNLCRCTGYVNIVRAARAAARQLASDPTPRAIPVGLARLP